MSYPEHVERLLGGKESWNEWRASEGIHVSPDLSFINVRDYNITTLAGFDLSRANLEGSIFIGCCLDKVELNHARCSWADFRRASFVSADIRNAWLHKVNFTEAELVNSDLNWSILSECALEKTNFENTMLYRTVLHNLDFRNAWKLETVQGIGTTIQSKVVWPDKIAANFTFDVRPKLFLSRSSADVGADEIIRGCLLEFNFFDIWDFGYSQRKNGSYREEITSEIQDAEIVIVVWSANSIQSEQVEIEIALALNSQKRWKAEDRGLDKIILPLVIDSKPTGMKEEDVKNWAALLENYDHIDFVDVFNFENGKWNCSDIELINAEIARKLRQKMGDRFPLFGGR